LLQTGRTILACTYRGSGTSGLVYALQRWLESKLKRPNLAAVVSVLVIGLSVAVPVTFVAQRLAVQAAKGAELVQTKVKSGEWRRALEAQPRSLPVGADGQALPHGFATRDQTLDAGRCQRVAALALYTLLQILSVTLFEKMPLQQALPGSDYKIIDGVLSNQLTLFAF
jgi:hypothetical protein